MPPEATGDTGFAAAFARGLLDPSVAPPTDVVGPRGKGAVLRYGVYRNNVTVSLIEALAGIYPATQRIVGTDFFRAMARSHVRATPPASPLLFEYGRDFPAFIEAFEHAGDLPWLADVARLERAWLDAYHEADASPLVHGRLAAIPPDRLGEVTFEAHPAARLLRSPYPAVSIFAMNRSDAPVSPLRSSEAEDALVTRPDAEVVVRRLAPGEAVLFGRLLRGESLAAAVGATLEEVPGFDLAAGLASLIESGAFTKIAPGDQS